jgi:hypothetical protein
MQSDSERACLARLHEMDEALARMEEELPDDMLPLGAEARKRVGFWLHRIAAGGANLEELSDSMREISGMMDALTARLLLVPWEGHQGPGGSGSGSGSFKS